MEDLNNVSVYHYAKDGTYENIQSLHIQKRTHDKISGANYRYHVSAFVNRLKEEHVLSMRENGFTVYNEMTRLYEYKLKLNSIRDVIDMKRGGLVISSTPLLYTIHETYWKKDYDAFIGKRPNCTHGEFNTWKKRWKERRYRVLLMLGLETPLSVDEYLQNEYRKKEKDMTGHVAFNVEFGNKSQYATYIPHVQVFIDNPIEIEKVTRII